MLELAEEFQGLSLYMDICMQKIYKIEPMSKEQYMLLYNITYFSCIQRLNKTKIYSNNDENMINRILYSQIKKQLEVHLETLQKQMDNLIEEDLLNQYLRLWEEYRFSSRVFNGICNYLNRQWAMERFTIGSLDIFQVYKLSMSMWTNKICKNFNVQIIKTILKLIKRDRCGDPINTCLVSRILNCYVELGSKEKNPYSKELALNFYRDKFECAFLQETERFYARESSDFILKNSITEYMKKVEKRLQEEDKRAEDYLHVSTKAPLIKICEKVLIENYVDSFISEFANMSNEDRFVDLNKMFELLLRIPKSLTQLSVTVESHIKAQGLSAIKKVKADEAINNPKLFIDTILDVYKKYTNVVKKVFKADKRFLVLVEKACESFINNNALTSERNDKNKPAMLLARYYDFVSKKSNNNPEGEELDNVLCQAMIVFKYIEDKDVFLQYYTELLAKRLILKRSVSDDVEISIITQFKKMCGSEYTRKLQLMFQDIEVSKDLNEKFKKHLKKSDTPSVTDFSVQVLTSGVWPLKQSILFSLPPELESSMQTFTRFFYKEHSGRKLQWLYHISRGEICTNCFENKYVFQASTFQIAVLLQFNNSLSLTLQELQEAIQLNMEYLIQVIQILLKVKVLLCDKEEKLTASSNLKLFTGFKNKRLRVNINIPLTIEQRVEQVAEKRYIDVERKFAVEATIIRIMKMRQTLKHQDLVMEVFDQTSKNFKPSETLIKRSIEKLIEKEYLMRAESSKDLYIYLA